MSIFSFIMTTVLTLELHSANKRIPRWMLIVGNGVAYAEYVLTSIVNKNIKEKGFKSFGCQLEEISFRNATRQVSRDNTKEIVGWTVEKSIFHEVLEVLRVRV